MSVPMEVIINDNVNTNPSSLNKRKDYERDDKDNNSSNKKIKLTIKESSLTNHEKGKFYEVYINIDLNQQPETKISYLWKDVPEQVLYDAGWITEYNKHRLERKDTKTNANSPDENINPLKDVGVDNVRVRKDESIDFIQCKNYFRSLRIEDIAGFSFIMLCHPNIKGILYHSNDKLSNHIKEHIGKTDKIKFIYKPIEGTNPEYNNIIQEEIKVDGDNINPINNMVLPMNINPPPMIKLYDYQEEIVNAYVEYYKDNNKAILSLPCGVGKTLISCFISKVYNVVIFISPLKQFAEQNIDRYKQYDPERNCLLVDSDGTRDVDVIKTFLQTHQKVMLSSTYKSCDVIVQILDILVNPFIIIDEFHNLSAKNIYGSQAIKIIDDEEDDLNMDEEKELNNNSTNSNNNSDNDDSDDSDSDDSDDSGSDEEMEDENITSGDDEELDEDLNLHLNNDEQSDASEESDEMDDESEKIDENNNNSNNNQDMKHDDNVDMDFTTYEMLFNGNIPTANDNEAQDALNILIRSNFKMLYMSATPRIYEMEDKDDCDVEDILGKTVYKMDFKSAIEKKYITDYKIYLPILQDNSKTELYQTLLNVEQEIDFKFNNAEISQKCAFLFEGIKQHGTLKCIVYLRSHKEIADFIKCFNKMNEYYAYDGNLDSITCDDSRNKRHEKINKFKNASLHSFLCSVNILDECIDIPECNSIYLTYSSTSKVKNVQRMARAMRLDKNNCNKEAKIFLWANEISDSLTFISSIKEIDLNYNQKVNYVQFNKGLIKEDKVKRQKYIDQYNAIIVGIKEYNGFNWDNKLKEFEDFITANKKYPSSHSKNETERKLGKWMIRQRANYKLKIKIMTHNNIYNTFTEFLNKYHEYFKSDIEIWNEKCDLMENFVRTHNKFPSENSTNEEDKKLGQWISRQKHVYKYKTGPMADENIYKRWTELCVKYPKSLIYKKNLWKLMFKKVKSYVKDNKKRPPRTSNIKEIKVLGIWVHRQITNFKKKSNGMKNEKNYNKWKNFTTKYPKLF